MVVNYYERSFSALHPSLFVIAARNHVMHDSRRPQARLVSLVTHLPPASISPKQAAAWRKIDTVVQADTDLVDINVLPTDLLIHSFVPLFIVKQGTDLLLSRYIVTLWTSGCFPIALYAQLKTTSGPLAEVVNGTLRPLSWLADISSGTLSVLVESHLMLVLAYCASRRRFAPLVEALRTLASTFRYAKVLTVTEGPSFLARSSWSRRQAKRPAPLVLATLVLLDQSKFDVGAMVHRLNDPFFTEVYQTYFMEGDRTQLIAQFQLYYQNDFFHYQMSHDFKVRVYWPAVPEVKAYLESPGAGSYADMAEDSADFLDDGEDLPPYPHP
ncbi:hypothetical protein H4R33_000788 [Dimargaris cristalligena]|nr:hypothetical protein H4R33_000788 [Dimargaris cristalligena]